MSTNNIGVFNLRNSGLTSVNVNNNDNSWYYLVNYATFTNICIHSSTGGGYC